MINSLEILCILVVSFSFEVLVVNKDVFKQMDNLESCLKLNSTYLEIGEAVVEVLEVDAGPPSRPRPRQPVLEVPRAVHLIRVQPDLVLDHLLILNSSKKLLFHSKSSDLQGDPAGLEPLLG